MTLDKEISWFIYWKNQYELGHIHEVISSVIPEVIGTHWHMIWL